MARHIEPLSGGLVTVRDPVSLQPGELSLAQNAVYRPGNQALYRATGRTVFGVATASANAVRGLRDLRFDNGDQFLLAMIDSTLATAFVGDTGTFANVTSYTSSGTALDAIHFNNEWFLFGGASTFSASASGNIVAYVSATSASQPLQIRTHGLIPNTTQVGTATGAGTWTAGVTGYFEYWFTEVMEYQKDGASGTNGPRVEGTFISSGAPTTMFISSNSLQATITVPDAPLNVNATKWVLYRAGPKANATDVLFPTGFKIGSGTFGVTNSVVDGGAAVTSYVAANATAAAGVAQFANATAIFASDNVYATHTGAVQGGVAAAFPTFTITNEPIIGVQVKVEGHKLTGSNPLITVDLSNNGGLSWGTAKVITPTFTTSDTTVELGSGTDTWGLDFTSADLTAGRFLVRVRAREITTVGSTSVFIDQVQARIWNAASKGLDESTPFPAIIISAAGVDAAVGSHGLPPLATTGDIFQGSLVTNSLSTGEQSFIRYSLPDQPDYFPAPYFIDFETPDNDIVTCVKTLNNRLGVFLQHGLWRVNYLPTEADADFNRGICRQQVSDYGCVNAMCAVEYPGPTGKSELAYVTQSGIVSTDLYGVRQLADDLNWSALLATANSTPIALVNDPVNKELLFYFKNSNTGNEHYKCLHLNYQDHHIRRGGKPTLSGPVHMRNYTTASGGIFADLYSAWVANRSNGGASVYLGYGGSAANTTAAGAGKVYIEGGESIPAQDPTLAIKTRRIYPTTLGSDLRLDRFLAYSSYQSSAQDLSFTPYITMMNRPAVVTGSTRTYSLSGESFFHLDIAEDAAGLEIGVAQSTANATGLGLQMLGFDYTPYGIEDSGR